MPEEPSEYERQRLLREVDRLQSQAAKYLPRASSVIGYPLYSSGGNVASFDLGTIRFDPGSFSIGEVARPVGGYFEVKVWYDDGRYETVRGYTSEPLRVGPEAGLREFKDGRRKVEEGDGVSLTGRVKAWKAAPNGRPQVPKDTKKK